VYCWRNWNHFHFYLRINVVDFFGLFNAIVIFIEVGQGDLKVGDLSPSSAMLPSATPPLASRVSPLAKQCHPSPLIGDYHWFFGFFNAIVIFIEAGWKVKMTSILPSVCEQCATKY
jgi:hypothetical protein